MERQLPCEAAYCSHSSTASLASGPFIGYWRLEVLRGFLALGCCHSYFVEHLLEQPLLCIVAFIEEVNNNAGPMSSRQMKQLRRVALEKELSPVLDKGSASDSEEEEEEAGTAGVETKGFSMLMADSSDEDEEVPQYESSEEEEEEEEQARDESAKSAKAPAPKQEGEGKGDKGGKGKKGGKSKKGKKKKGSGGGGGGLKASTKKYMEQLLQAEDSSGSNQFLPVTKTMLNDANEMKKKFGRGVADQVDEEEVKEEVT